MESGRPNYGQFVWTGVVAAALAFTALYHLGAPKKVLFEENHHVEISLGDDFVEEAPQFQTHTAAQSQTEVTATSKHPLKRHPSSARTP